MRMAEPRLDAVHGEVDEYDFENEPGTMHAIGIRDLDFQDANENELEIQLTNRLESNNQIGVIRDDRNYQDVDSFGPEFEARNDEKLQPGYTQRIRDHARSEFGHGERQIMGNKAYHPLGQQIRDDRRHQRNVEHVQSHERAYLPQAKHEHHVLRRAKLADTREQGHGYVDNFQQRDNYNNVRPHRIRPKHEKPMKPGLDIAPQARQIHPTGTKRGMVWRPRQINNDWKDNKLQLETVQTVNPTARNMTLKNKPIADNSTSNIHMGTPVEKPSSGHIPGIKIVERELDDSVHEIQHDIEPNREAHLRGQILNKAPLFDNTTLQGLEKEVQIQNENDAMRLKPMNPRQISQKNPISIEGMQDFDSTKQRMMVKQPPRPMAEKAKLEKWNPNVDFAQQRTRTQWRGLNEDKQTSARNSRQMAKNSEFGNVDNRKEV
jgi:hypothetical protein